MLRVATSCSGQVQQPERPLADHGRPLQPSPAAQRPSADPAPLLATDQEVDGWDLCLMVRAYRRERRS